MAAPECVALKRVDAPASPDDGRRVLATRDEAPDSAVVLKAVLKEAPA